MRDGGHERFINKALLDAASVVGLAQDSRDADLLVLSRSVLWKWPKALQGMVPPGVSSALPGGGPPWIVERTLGVSTLGSERDSMATARGTLSLLRATASSEEAFGALKE